MAGSSLRKSVFKEDEEGYESPMKNSQDIDNLAI